MFGRFQKLSRNPTFACNNAWKKEKAVDKGEYVSALFLDLSKAFDTIINDLLLAELRASRFSLNALKLMHRYLINRK